MKDHEAHVDEARERVAEAESLVAKQVRRIMQLRWQGVNTTDDARVLDELKHKYRTALEDLARAKAKRSPHDEQPPEHLIRSNRCRNMVEELRIMAAEISDTECRAALLGAAQALGQAADALDSIYLSDNSALLPTVDPSTRA